MIFPGFKRKLAILLTSVFIYNTFGFLLMQPLFTIYFEHLGTQRAANPSDEEKIELVTLKKEDIQLKKINFKKISSEEFKLNGKYFDIVKEVERDSFIYFYCVNDEREDALEKDFRQRVNENSSNKKQTPDTINPFKTSTTEPVTYTICNKPDTGNKKYQSYNSKISMQSWGEVPTPPPKSFLSV